MIVPLTAAQASASRMSTSGEAGFAGGGLPVAARHDVLPVHARPERARRRSVAVAPAAGGQVRLAS